MEDKKTPPSTPSWGTPKSSKPAAPAATSTTRPDVKVAQAKPAAPASAKPAASKPATPAAPTGENKYTQWYEVKSGDTLWKIAKERYGDGNLYTEIFKANQDVLTDPDKIKVGQKLRIP